VYSVLSGSTLDALKEFYADRDARLKQFEDLKAGAEENASERILSMDAFAEDWNESQFWVLFRHFPASIPARPHLSSSLVTRSLPPSSSWDNRPELMSCGK
jgi:hypothetical protein